MAPHERCVGAEPKEIAPNDLGFFVPQLFNYCLFLFSSICSNSLPTASIINLTLQFRYAQPYDKLGMLVGIICAILSGFGQPALALVSCRISNVMLTVAANTHEFRTKAYENVYIFIGLAALITIVNYVQYMCFSVCCIRITTKIRHHFLKSVLRQNAGWFDKNHSGTITTQLNDNIERIREGIGDKLGLLVRGGAMFVGAIIISFIYQWRIAFVMLGIAPISCIIMAELAQQMGASTAKELVGVGKAGSIAEEAVLGVRTVQAFNGQEELVERYTAELSKGKKHGIIKSLWSGFLGGLFYLFLNAFSGAGLLYGGHLLRIGIMDKPGDVFTAMFAMLLGAYFLGLVSPHLMVLLNARVAAGVIYDTIDRTPPIDVYSTAGKTPKSIEGRVVFRDVHFRYPTRKNVKILNGLNLVIEPGQTVALVGHSGCGKSTSVGLLTRLYEPESGSVTIDGIDVREFNISYLRNVIGIVQQEPVLFNDTLENNLRFGNPNATLQQMKDACRMANAESFIEKLPEGFKTRIGEGGVQLSGGQKQRIAIARALIRNPKILLLDEATSALDAQSEAIVQEALNNAAVGRTTIMIAHRLSTVRNADKICVFEKGNIVEHGTHQELVELGGRYAQLVKAQQFQHNDDEEDFLGNSFDADGRTRTSTILSSRSSHSGVEAFMRGNSQNDSFASEKFEPSIIRIYKEAKGNYLYMITGTICAAICGLHLPSICLINKYVFVAFSAQPYGDEMIHRLCMALTMLCCCGFGVTIFQFLSSALFGIASENMSLSFRIRSFRSILLQDAAYFDNPEHTPGKLITRLATDSPNVKAVIDSRMLQVIYGVTALLVNMIIGYIYCWQVTTIGFGFALFLAVLQVTLAMMIQKRTMQLVANDEAGRLAVEIFENVQTIQLLTREEVFYANYEVASKRHKRSEISKAWIEAVNFCVSQTFQFYMQILTFAVGIHIMNKEMKPPDKAFIAIIAMLLGAVGVMNAASYFPEFVKARTTSGLLFGMIYRKPRTGDYKQGEKTTLRGNIMFEGVKFSYPLKPNDPVMKNLQFSASRGQTVALVGPSGCGKSTAIALLERFYDPKGGFVRLDGKDLSKLCLYHVRTQIALVGQEPRLFAGTIRDNICLGMEQKPSDDKIRVALEIANASSFVQGLPNGLDTDVGEKGSKLSGGQKQRIAIARALVRDPKILLLDEATSALDSEAEKAVQEALDRAREGRTCITIAHRLSSIQNSNLIIYVDRGKVREQGTHAQLMALKGHYYDLIKKQDLAG
uniref:ABC transporter domain-containing protein n=1 Tax=Syphacia muris TaxID=451379 RepID=A0A158R4T0_9BILA